MGTLRKVMTDMTLTDGTKLPAGTYLGTNPQSANFDNSTLENPKEFDGFRYVSGEPQILRMKIADMDITASSVCANLKAMR